MLTTPLGTTSVCDRGFRMRAGVIGVVAALAAGLALLAAPGAAMANNTLEQCENGKLSAPHSCTFTYDPWVTGNLGGHNAHYMEGQVVPFRFVMDSLAAGPHTVTFEWDTLKNGLHAYDFIYNFNYTETDADPCVDVDPACSVTAGTWAAIPPDPIVESAKPGAQPLPATGRPSDGQFFLWGGSGLVVHEPVAVSGADQPRRVTVTFTKESAGPAVLAWGGHIAAREDWGAGQAAGTINGSPYHMRLIDLDGTGGNQDRSISSDAIYLKSKVILRKDARPDDAQDFNFTATGAGISPTTFQLDDDADPALPSAQVFDDILDYGTKTFTEGTLPAGWAYESITCTEDEGTDNYQVDDSTRTVSIPLEEGETVDCTVVNRGSGRVRVVKSTDPDGSAELFEFSPGAGLPAGNFSKRDGDAATEFAVDPGTYEVSELAEAGWDLASISCSDADSSGDVAAARATFRVAAGETVTCTFTNRQHATVTVIKDAVPNDEQDFVFTATGAGLTGFSLDDDGDETNALRRQRSFTISEPGQTSVTEAAQAGWRLSGIDCTGTTESVDGRTVSFAVAPGDAIVCTFTNVKLNPSITIEKFGPAFAYHGDTLSFLFEVRNPSDAPLHDVVVTDDRCAPVALKEKRDDDGDDLLEAGEVWAYECSYVLAAHAAGEEDPIHNTATVTANDEQDRAVGPATDDHLTEVLHPAVQIDKTGPAGANAGDRVEFTLTVTNPGDVALTADSLVVTDTRCDAPPEEVARLRGGQADATPSSLDPGDSWVYRCFVQTRTDEASVTNVARVDGRDVNGRSVSDDDDHQVDLIEVAPVSTVSEPADPSVPDFGTTLRTPPPTAIEAGASRLHGPSRCASRAFTVRVKGKRIQSVVWRIDRKVVARFASRTGEATRAKLRVDPKRYGRGLHRLKARVVYTSASQTRPKTMRMTFRLCATRARAPRFAG